MALRAQKMGMRIMINFHYSDTWADPGKQAKPTAWANHVLQLLNDVYSHTFDVLTALKAAGVTQNGYKLGMKFGGMLWPEEVLQIGVN
jgi:arabinogalactan endo-1,4-beta-galactosidase